MTSKSEYTTLFCVSRVTTERKKKVWVTKKTEKIVELFNTYEFNPKVWKVICIILAGGVIVFIIIHSIIINRE